MNEPKLHVLVVDDVPLARQRLARLLQLFPDVALVGSCPDAEAALAELSRAPVDLLLLDVDMPECDGFALLEQLPARPAPSVVFCTAHANFAQRAFRVNALDYLLKPVQAAQLREALDRAWMRKRQGAQAPAYLVLRERDGTRVLAMASIDWIEAAGNYVCIRAEGETHVHREALARIEARLDPASFQRIHRSRIVNLERIARLLPLNNGDHRLVLRDGTELNLSRTYRDSLFARLPG